MSLITRKVYAQVPPKVEYKLSEIGQEFKLVLEQIETFGDKYINFAQIKKIWMSHLIHSDFCYKSVSFDCI